VLLTLFTGCYDSGDIVVQKFTMQWPTGEKVFSEQLLMNEVAETEIEHVALTGPLTKTVAVSNEYVNMFIFIKGKGLLIADTNTYNLVPESLAIPATYDSIVFDVPKGEVLHYVLFKRLITESDKNDFDSYPEENKVDMFFTEFADCEPYSEKIKSPNTISRTVLPQDIMPRLALGTVEAPGPDAVGAHEHAMLDQLFLGLAGNDITAHADDKSTAFGEFELLHIPKGSSHWVTVGENKMMYYLWMDFFTTKEGQEWLKTHKPVSKDKKDY
jgi:hypothetical protein